MQFAPPDELTGNLFRVLGSGTEQRVAHSFEEAKFILQRHFPQKYTLLERTAQCQVKLQHKKLKHVLLSSAWFSPAMEIYSAPATPFYALYFRLYGSSEYTVHKHSFVTSPARGAFLPGLQPVRVITEPNWHVFSAKFSPEVLQKELSRLLDREVVRSLEFDPAVHFDRGAGMFVRRCLTDLFKKAGKQESCVGELALEQAEQALMTLILEGLRHNYSKFINGPEREIAPWQLRVVEEFIRESADQPLSLGDLAAVSGVSSRSLQSMFLRRRGYSPMEFVRRVRFERVRDELLHPKHNATVTSSAMQWGFSHPSRFAMDYHAKFGEKPSETLRRAMKQK